MKTTIVMILASVFCIGCGDLGDPVLETVAVEVDNEVTQTLDIDSNGSNFLPGDVDAMSIFVVTYDEPIDLTTAKEHIYLTEADGGTVDIDITQRRLDVIITPEDGLVPDLNHELVIEGGIDDAAGNTDFTEYVISLYVSE